jgi:hypothetical protein
MPNFSIKKPATIISIQSQAISKHPLFSITKNVSSKNQQTCMLRNPCLFSNQPPKIICPTSTQKAQQAKSVPKHNKKESVRERNEFFSSRVP